MHRIRAENVEISVIKVGGEDCIYGEYQRGVNEIAIHQMRVLSQVDNRNLLK